MKISLPAFAIKRPITICMVVLALASVGWISWSVIQVEFIMPMDFPVIRCMIPYHGATPEQVETEIAIPAEGEFRSIQNLNRIYSRSDAGGCYVMLSFDWGSDMSAALAAVRDRMDRLKLVLPGDADRCFIRRYDSDSMSILSFALFTDGNATELAQWARERLEPRLMRLEGVAEVRVDGAGNGTVHVEFDQEALNRNSLSLYQVVARLKKSSVELSVGELMDGESKHLVRFANELSGVPELRNVIVGPGGVRLKDVAAVNQHGAGGPSGQTIDGKRGVFVNVLKESTANTIDTCAAVKAELDTLKSDPMLADAEVFVFGDHSQDIMTAVTMLANAGKSGGVLALIVLLLFMRRIRATLLIALSVPISLVVAFIYIYFAGKTLNTVTVTAMVISVGMLVDNSIVVMENILRYRELGFSPAESCRKGASEVGLAITTATLTTIVVFVPVFYMSASEISIYMREFAAPVAVALAASLLVSLTVIPLVASRFVLPKRRPKTDRIRSLVQSRVPIGAHIGGDGRGSGPAQKPLGRAVTLYARGLAWVTHWRLATVLILGALVAVTALIPYRKVGMQQMPTVDWRRVEVNVKLDQNYDWPNAKKVFKGIEDIVEEYRVPLDIKNILVSPGTHGGSVSVYLRPLETYTSGDEPPVSTKKACALLKARLPKQVPGGDIVVAEAKGAGPARQYVSVRMRGKNTQLLASYAEQFKRLVETLPDVTGVVAESENTKDEIQLRIDETLASRAGISPYVVARTVGFALRGTRLFYLQGEKSEVPVEAHFGGKDRQSMADLDNIALRGSTGVPVTLNRLVTKRAAKSPKAIQRVDGRNVIVVTAEATTKDLGGVKRNLDGLIASFRMPDGYTIETGEELTQLDTSREGFLKALILAIILIYLVMGALFESYLLPLSILTSVPLAFLGVYWAMFITHTPMDSIALIGSILMCGVIVNNGIVIVDHINLLRRQGLERTEAILQAGRDRFRPVMMTALTTILACFPLAVGSHIGEVAFNSLGRGLIGGLTTGTLLTLFVVPLFYTLVDDVRLWFVDYFGALSGLRSTNPT